MCEAVDRGHISFQRMGLMKLSVFSRFGAAVAIVAASALALTVGVAAPASAQDVAVPINGLPTAIESGVGYTTAGGLGNANVAAMAWIYKLASTPELQSALKSQAAGTATMTETDLIASAASKITTPAGVGTLVKSAGVAGNVYGSWKLGTAIGNGVGGKITQSIWGVSADDLVCRLNGAGSVGQTMLSELSGADCGKWNAAQEQAINDDVQPGTTLSLSWTTPSGVTITYQGAPSNQGPDGWTYASACFSASGTVPANTAAIAYGYSDTAVAPADYQNYGDVQSGAGAYYTPCPASAPYQLPLSSGPRAAQINSLAAAFKPLCLGPSADVDQVPFDCTSGAKPKTDTQTADPDRYVSCDVTGPNAYESVSGAVFKETDGNWTDALPACPSLAAGVMPTNTSMVLHTVGGTDQTLWSHDLDPAVTKGISGDHAHCLQTVCQTVLEKADGSSCFDGAQTQCAGWFTDPNKTTDYKCEYDGETLDLSTCNYLAPTFEPDRDTKTGTYGDPITGKATPASPNPSEAAAADPSDDAQIQKSPVVDPDDSTSECFKSAFGTFNPLVWVERPVQCAISWAFVPPKSTLPDAQAKIHDEAEETMPGKIAATVGAMTIAPDLAGCNGIAVPKQNLPYFTLPDRIMSACPGEALHSFATMVQVVAGFAIGAGGLVGLTWIVAEPFGYRGIGRRDGGSGE